MAIRKDANTLSTAERAEFVATVHELKRTGVYDQFVLRHANTNMRAIHRSPAFLPWHRRFIWDFERELQRVSGNPELGLPYWNWPEGGANASMWDDDLLGGNGDISTQIVNRGPFRAGQWSIVNSSGADAGPLRRAFGSQGWAQTLPTLNEIEQVLAITPYDISPWSEFSNPSFRNQLEGFDGPNLHNRGHGWVAGSMLPMTSPNDPVFFLHHCMVDKLWHEWQLRHPTQGYLPVSGAAFGQNLTDPMAATNSSPVGPRPLDVLDSATLDIQYDQLLAGTSPPPSTQPDVIELMIGSNANATISIPGEENIFTFDAPAFGSYTIETSGSSDTVMTLFGPDNPNQQIAFNDDGGQGLNSRITQTLAAGTYIVRIRLYNPNSTGNYSIRVQSNAVDVAIPDINVDGPPVNAAISVGRESDLYHFHIDSQGFYTIETSGSTDTFLTLLGPDQTSEIAVDDDSGEFLNSRIRARLAPGEYFARVRHYSDFGTGPYSLSVHSG